MMMKRILLSTLASLSMLGLACAEVQALNLTFRTRNAAFLNGAPDRAVPAMQLMRGYLIFETDPRTRELIAPPTIIYYGSVNGNLVYEVVEEVEMNYDYVGNGLAQQVYGKLQGDSSLHFTGNADRFGTLRNLKFETRVWQETSSTPEGPTVVQGGTVLRSEVSGNANVLRLARTIFTQEQAIDHLILRLTLGKYRPGSMLPVPVGAKFVPAEGE